MGQRPSVADVAERAAVSVGTVSNVLNRPERVAPATRERVRRAIDELDFVPSASARQLRVGVAQSVGAVLHDIATPCYTTLARGIEDRLNADGLALLFNSSDGIAERERRSLRQFEQHGVRGIVVTPVDRDRTALRALRDRGTPVVLVDTTPDDELPSVSCDDVEGGRLAVEHLLAAGHDRVLLLNGDTASPQHLSRWEGARAAVRAADRDPDEALVERTLHQSPGLGADPALSDLLAQRGPNSPTAVFCINDLVALSVLRTALAHGLSVPDDLAVIGFEDGAFASKLLIPLTTVRRPARRVGSAAADLLLRISDGSLDPRQAHRVTFPPELVIRESTRVTWAPPQAAAS